MSKAYVKIVSKQDGKTLQDLDHANDLIVKKKDEAWHKWFISHSSLSSG